MASRPLAICLAALLVRAAGALSTRCDGSTTTATDVDITLVTQSSQDRLWRIGHLCERWRGPIALAVGADDLDTALAEGRRAARKCERAEVRARLAPDANAYPVNALRNLAWAAATTSHVLLLDVDFFPSVDARSALLRALTATQKRRRPLEPSSREASGTALVLPAFTVYPREADSELKRRILGKLFATLAATEDAARLVPKTREELLACLERGGAPEPLSVAELRRRKRLRPEQSFCDLFHGHRTTRFHEWLGRRDPGQTYRIPCFVDSAFEPYLVVPRCGPPRFDERYVGYGKNKLEWIAHLRGVNFEFRVVPRAFCVHAPHTPSAANAGWSVWGADKDPESHRSKMDLLYGERIASLGLYDLTYKYARLLYTGNRKIREGLLATPICAATIKNKADVGKRSGTRDGAAHLAPSARACLEGRCPLGADHVSAAAWERIDERTRNASAAKKLGGCLRAIKRTGWVTAEHCS